MIVFGDAELHTAAGNLFIFKLYQSEQWKKCTLIDTLLPVLILIDPFKKEIHRVFDCFQVRLSCTIAAFNRLAQWNGLPINEDSFVPLSIAEFILYPD
jgi:hypothetical protein